MKFGKIFENKISGDFELLDAFGEPAFVFKTKAEAEKYLKEKGVKGVVAGISFKGKTGEEIAQKEQAYRGGLQAEKTRKSDLEKLYATRQEQAAERVGRIREAAADYDAATTPAQKEAARGRAEAARLEGMLEEATRRMPQEQKQKVAAGLAGVLQRRGEREARVQRETAQAQAESRAQRAGIAQERALGCGGGHDRDHALHRVPVRRTQLRLGRGHLPGARHPEPGDVRWCERE